MAVVVDHGGKKTEHADAYGFRLSDGHLIVLSAQHATADLVAVYAPSSWQNAVVQANSSTGH